MFSNHDRAALNDPALRADSTAKAYVLESLREGAKNTLYAGNAWAFRHGMEKAGQAGTGEDTEGGESEEGL